MKNKNKILTLKMYVCYFINILELAQWKNFEVFSSLEKFGSANLKNCWKCKIVILSFFVNSLIKKCWNCFAFR